MQKSASLIEIARNKNILLCSHWDADGIASAALVYHLLKPFAKEISSKTKGMPFLIKKEDITQDAEVIVCIDIAPSQELLSLNKKIAYIDHHPADLKNKEQFAFLLHNEAMQSTSLLVYQDMVQDKSNPYNVFLALIGYFGDCGKLENLPKELLKNADSLMPELIEVKHGNGYNSYKNDGYLEISRYVSLLNAGKRVHWSGDVPLELLKSIDSHIPILYALHPIVHELKVHQASLRGEYLLPIQIESGQEIDYALINSSKNVQGVLASRHLKNRPLLIINTYKDTAIGSLRVPEHLDFDAGGFLNLFNGKISSFIGGGHEKAGGFTMDAKHLDALIGLLKIRGS
ncbi:DHH family phosphoesterase [archaeon]|nr:DHH family phosphoesterase [archaeon]